MDLIFKCKNEIYNIGKTKTKRERSNLLKNFDNCVITAIAEISKNCLLGNIPLSKCNYNKIKKYKNDIRKIASKRTTLKKRRNLIVQKGGFLNILIPTVLSLLANVIEKRLSK